ncbi:MAG TPA: hypothetical protein PLO05_03210 [Bacteroidales bacterium]|nr:hypothetical protein [Bacteroidales bacterium]
MKRITIFLLILIPLIILLLLGGIRLSKNSFDPLWTDLDKLIRKETFYYLEDKRPELDSLFMSIQKDSSFSDIDAFELIADPFPLTMEYKKFENAVNFLQSNKRMLVLGVTGSGRSSLLNRLAKFFAVDDDHIITLYCVPRLEVEYHKQWIGYTDNGVFYKGKLLKFFEEAHADPEHNFVLIIDDIDLIYPNTFFGAEIWNELENSNYDQYIEGYDVPIKIPKNFYLITTTKTGPGSVIKFNDEHYRRLSPNGVYEVCPDSVEFLLYLKRKFENQPDEIKYEYVQKLLYSFIRINNIICKDIGKGYMLGQWSTIRKSINPDEYNDFTNKFILHINALNPESGFSESNISDVIFSANNQGEMRGSNFFAQTYEFFYESGIFSEASVAILFLILSSIVGYLFFLKRKHLIRNYVVKVYKISEDFENGNIDYDNVISCMKKTRNEIDKLAMQHKINYTESLFIYNLISDRSKMISESKNTEDVYNKMFEEFFKDKSISEKEYNKLKNLVEKSRSKISEKYYQYLIERLKEIKPL